MTEIIAASLMVTCKGPFVVSIKPGPETVVMWVLLTILFIVALKISQKNSSTVKKTQVEAHK